MNGPENIRSYTAASSDVATLFGSMFDNCNEKKQVGTQQLEPLPRGAQYNYQDTSEADGQPNFRGTSAMRTSGQGPARRRSSSASHPNEWNEFEVEMLENEACHEPAVEVSSGVQGAFRASSADPSITENSSSTRRVHFQDDWSSHDAHKDAISSRATTVVSRWPWTDHKGIHGAYTGQVNESMQPHGSGVFVYDEDDKTAVAKACTWRDGRAVGCWRPKCQQAGPSSTDRQAPPHPRQEVPSNETFLPHLDIGSVGTDQDMLPLEASDLTKVGSLEVHDFAFILRSDGRSWTYAIVAGRDQDNILFVVDQGGSTKMMSRWRWSSQLRLVKTPRNFCKDDESKIAASTLHGSVDKPSPQPVSRAKHEVLPPLPPLATTRSYPSHLKRRTT